MLLLNEQENDNYRVFLMAEPCRKRLSILKQIISILLVGGLWATVLSLTFVNNVWFVNDEAGFYTYLFGSTASIIFIILLFTRVLHLTYHHICFERCQIEIRTVIETTVFLMIWNLSSLLIVIYMHQPMGPIYALIFICTIPFFAVYQVCRYAMNSHSRYY